MLDRKKLVKALSAHLRRLEDDLRTQAALPEHEGRLEQEWNAEREDGRTADTYPAWLDRQVTQVGAAWLISMVLVRFLEDTGLVDVPQLSGPAERGRRAEDERLLYFQRRPADSDRDYLRHVFAEVAALPGCAALFDCHNLAVGGLPPSGDACEALLAAFRERDPDTGDLHWDFSDLRGDTRFLGDLYQDLSEAARKRYALLQTPDFIEEFLLDRTLTPALEEYGLDDTTLLDPACGSGHFLLGAFARLVEAWAKKAPGASPRDRAQRALDAVWGVDLNPFAAAIARFRLLAAALKTCGIERLEDAPDFRVHVTVGDSLLAGGSQTDLGLGGDWDSRSSVEDPAALQETFSQRYAAVVANPPYITPKDKALNGRYRKQFPRSCHRQYSLGVPFTEQCFRLARQGGFVGLITANSFMKREFGKKIIEQVLPKFDLTLVVDTSGAYIPGHGTPTVLLLGRNRAPVGDTLRAVLGIRGEPTTPANPAQGRVWSSIRDRVGEPGYEDDYVSVVDLPRSRLASHPWSLGGGGAAELRERLEDSAVRRLGELAASVGCMTISGEDNCLVAPSGALARHGLLCRTIPLGIGEQVRDWRVTDLPSMIWPNNSLGEPLDATEIPQVLRYLWRYRTSLRARRLFGELIESRGLSWWEIREIYQDRLQTPLTIAYAEVATHNHFVLDRGGKVFKQTAPVIKLPAEATEDEHLALLGLLNSSTACFWMKQVFHNKGMRGQGGGITSDTWEQFYQFDATKIRQAPLRGLDEALPYSRRLDSGARRLAADRTASALNGSSEPSIASMVFVQEELDWRVYEVFGLTGDPLVWGGSDVPLQPGLRAFEIVMARRMARGDLATAWFERHGTEPATDVPDDWPPDYRLLVESRIELIENDRDIRLCEQPEHKRRWQREPWDKRVLRTTQAWLLDRLEIPAYVPWTDRDAPAAAPPAAMTVAQLAESAAGDEEFRAVATVFKGHGDFDLAELIAELVQSDAVPDIPALVYRDGGLRKRAAWEETWALQRREDAGEEIEILVPPRYTSADFQKPVFWRLRGKLDVPKERFISLPYAQREGDPAPPLLWAGFDHLQHATAVASLYMERKDIDDWEPERLVPFLTSLDQLVPWLKQWHNEPSVEFQGDHMGDFYEAFVAGQCQDLGLTLEEVRGWQPPKKAKRRRTKA